MSYYLSVGDLEPDMLINVSTLAGGPSDLTSAIDVSLQWQKPDGTVTTVELVMVDASQGQVKRVWASGDSAIPGTHMGRVIVTWSNSEVSTYPNDNSSIIWWVTPQFIPSQWF